MTKRELIDALEKCPLPDDAEVLKTHWESVEDATGWEVEASIYGIATGSRTESIGRKKPVDCPVILL